MYVDVLVDVRAGLLVCSLVGFSQQIFCHEEWFLMLVTLGEFGPLPLNFDLLSLAPSSVFVPVPIPMVAMVAVNWGERERGPSCGLNGRAVTIYIYIYI